MNEARKERTFLLRPVNQVGYIKAIGVEIG